MPTSLSLIILMTAFITACISGIFGMAGGLIFMGVIASFLGVAEAMVVHGFVQGIANSSRAFFIRKSIRWDLYFRMGFGALPALALLGLAAFVPSKGVLFLGLGILPGLLWLPKTWISLDITRPFHGVLCGFFVTALNLVAGVAGPALDMFFVKTNLPRHEIVATKALTMFTSHMMKILYFGIPLMRAGTGVQLPPIWVFIAAIPVVIAGTFLGTKILHRLSDIGFRAYTKWLVTLVGFVYIFKGLALISL